MSWIDDLEADRGVGARFGTSARLASQALAATKSKITLALASARAISALRPPSCLAQRSASI